LRVGTVSKSGMKGARGIRKKKNDSSRKGKKEEPVSFL